MRVRTLLTTTVAGLLLAGTTGTAAMADPGPLPANRTGHLVAWGTAAASAYTEVPASLDGKQVVAVSATDNGTAAVTDDGHVTAWGASGANGVDFTPADLTGVATVSLNVNNGMALRTDGTVVAWGAQAGIDAVPAGLTAKAVSMSGNGTAYAVRTDGTLASWGLASGPGNPAPPDGLTNLVDVSASAAHALALDASGDVTVWGSVAMLETPPADIQGHVRQIATGSLVSGAILDDGSVRLWGLGAPAVPAALDGKTVVSLDVGSNAIAATDDGEVITWGSTAEITTLPEGLANEPVAAVSVAAQQAVAIVTDFRAVTAPTVAGTPTVGQTLTATPAEFSLTPDAAATGQWLADGTPLEGKTGTTLPLDATLIGKKISYRTTATRGSEPVQSTSTEVGPVAKVSSTTAVSVAPASARYGTQRTATATVARTGGTPTGTVTFTMGSSHVTASLTADGTATWSLPQTLAVGTQSVTAAYGGDATTAASTSAPAAVTVSKAASTLKAAKPKVAGKTKKLANRTTFTLKVTTAVATSPAGKVVLTLKGKTNKKVVASVNAKGVATVVVRNLKRGSYKATWAYSGSSTVAGGTRTVSFKV